MRPPTGRRANGLEQATQFTTSAQTLCPNPVRVKPNQIYVYKAAAAESNGGRSSSGKRSEVAPKTGIRLFKTTSPTTSRERVHIRIVLKRERHYKLLPRSLDSLQQQGSSLMA